MAEENKESKKQQTEVSSTSDRRVQISQSDVPSMSLEQALRVPRAIAEHYAGGSVTALQLAAALNMTPTSGPFRTLCGASIAYGLTEGGYNAKEITISALGKRIVKPLSEGDDLLAKREATLKPRVLGEFLEKYNNSSLPRPDIGRNVLESMNVPSTRTESVFNLIVESARAVGFIRTIKDKEFVDLHGVAVPIPDVQAASDLDQRETDFTVSEPARTTLSEHATNGLPSTANVTKHSTPIDEEKYRKVFITHGKNRELIDPIKTLLQFGELIPVVSIHNESVSKPVPKKVMDEMRTCGAAIIHVADEARLLDQEGNVRVVLNENVLIEIGAAMALFEDRFILLVKNGTQLPSNLQGLYQVRYDGETLDVHATIQLMKAINEMKNFKPLERGTAASAQTV